MEIDILGCHRPSGDEVYVECKFQQKKFSANVVDLMVGQAFRRTIERAALFSASEPGKEAQGAIEELRADGRLSFSFYGPDEMLRALVDSAAAPQLPTEIPANVSNATLVVHPEHNMFWLLQQEENGRPVRALLSGSDDSAEDLEDLRAVLDDHEVLIGLPLHLATQSTAPSGRPKQKAPSEMVSTVVTADDLIDYRPARPADFVGRTEMQREIWTFLGEVRGRRSNTRILALVGASGFGKSSLVAKLAERFKNKKWRGKYFLYPVDVRSARGPLFVAEAMLAGMRAAEGAGFINLPEDLRVTDADAILDGDSIQSVLQGLRNSNKVLAVFFDQFEEAFTKDALFPVFTAFRRAALDVHAAQENLVFGFSWRTGVSLSDDNPAYQLWNELRDHRLTKTLKEFEPSESSHLITLFEKALDAKLLPPLRRRLQEQGQGLPWFLKKLCIHVYKEIDCGTSQIDLLGSRLNVAALFSEDLDPLTDSELACIRAIAEHSPADALEIYERFGDDVVNSIIEKRLVVRAGTRLAVYWDIFRDYLTDGNVPFIPLTYIPNASVRMALSACVILAERGKMAVDDLARELGYASSTTVNIATDLQNLALIGRSEEGEYHLLADVGLDDLASQLRSQLTEHVMYRALLREAGLDGTLGRGDGVQIVRELYAASQVKPKTRDNYLTRLIPWFEFAGLVDVDRDGLTIHSEDSIGKRFGEFPTERKASRQPTFLGTAPPERAVRLLSALIKQGSLEKEALFREYGRNEAADLVALKLAEWRTGEIVAPPWVLNASAPADQVLAEAVAKDETLRKFDRLIQENPGEARAEIGARLGIVLGRSWKKASALRYSNGLWRYREIARKKRRRVGGS